MLPVLLSQHLLTLSRRVLPEQQRTLRPLVPRLQLPLPRRTTRLRTTGWFSALLLEMVTPPGSRTAH